MNSLNFWKDWSKPEKAILALSCIVIFTCLSIYFFRFYLGVTGAISWETNLDVQRVEQPLSTFEIFGELIEINGSNFLTRTFFNASAIELDEIHTKLFFGFICFSIILILTGISFVKKMAWFAGAMTAVGVGLYFFSFDLIEAFGFQNNMVLSVGFILFIGITALFNLINDNRTGLLTRLLSIAFVVITFFTVIILNAEVAAPIYYLTNYSAKSVTVVVFLFSALVGYDIIATFFYIITSSKSFSTVNTLTNFLVITSLYLGSLLIFFLHQINYISWNLTLFNPFILLAVSTVIGFWGQYKRRELYLDVVSYRKGGIWVYLGMVILSISSIAYAFQTSNTAMIASFEEGIIYTHLTMGGAFVIYVIKNFRVPVLQGVQVWEKLYFPSRLTHRFTRFIGLVSIVLLVVVDQNKPVRRWKAGLSNYKADVYQQEGEYLLAEQNYHLAYAFYPDNFKAHYTLAMMAFDHGDVKKSIKLFRDMVRFRMPNEFALVNLANAYGEQGDYYNAHFTLKKALAKYPDNAYLQNNLAFYAEKEKDLKDVYFNYTSAQKKLPKRDKHFAYGNLLAFAENFEKGPVVDSLITSEDYNQYIAVLSNRLALGNLNGIKVEHELFNLKDTLADVQETSYLINALNSSLGQLNLNIKTEQLIQSNTENKDLLAYALAVNATRRLEYFETDSLIKQTVMLAKPSVEPYYYFEAGKIYLAFGDVERAEICFKESYKNQPFNPINDAPIYLAELFLAKGKAKEGVELLQELTQFEPTKERANHLLYALSFKEANELDSLPKEVLIDVANFNPWFIQSGMLEAILEKGKLDEPVALACFRRAIAHDKYAEADAIYEAIESVKTIEKSPFVKLRLEQLTAQQRYKELVLLSGSKQLKGYDKVFEAYFDGVVAERLGNVSFAEKSYKKAINTIPFYKPLGLTVVNFYTETKKDEKSAYNAILELIDYHEMSLEYNFMYIHLALSQGEFFFADETFKDIEELQLMSHQDFLKYKEVYDAKRAHAIERFEDVW
jgi:tetratricopeptide (TPR) repeat protein